MVAILRVHTHVLTPTIIASTATDVYSRGMEGCKLKAAGPGSADQQLAKMHCLVCCFNIMMLNKNNLVGFSKWLQL